jgi:uncharacterized membrane protein YsdA (DUF1294 family)
MPRHWVIAIASCAGGAAALWRYAATDALTSWLVAITVVTFLAYAYDKAIAGSARLRVPERLLLALALAGGALGAFLGMYLLRHKTAKSSFQVRFWLVVAVEIAAVVAYALYAR